MYIFLTFILKTEDLSDSIYNEEDYELDFCCAKAGPFRKERGSLNRVREKLRSEKGASITFGLILFLVCAVASGIIIVASTAAAGRINGVAESDQKYYAVTSAAQLLKETISNQNITIVKEKDVVDTTTYNGDGAASGETEENGATNIYLVPGTANDLDYASLGDTYPKIKNGEVDEWAAPPFGSLDNKDKMGEYFAYRYALLTNEGGDDGRINLKLTSSDEGLNVDLIGQMTEDGQLTLQVKSAGDKPYILTMEFEADKKTSHDTGTEEMNPDGNRDGNAVVLDSKSYTKNTISWKLASIENVK